MRSEGKRKIKLVTGVTGEFKVRVGGRTIVISSVPRQKCSSCGEEYFDRESNAILDRYRKTTDKTAKLAA
jgi:YgiT-type zinc finger domain-containing protein